MKKIVILLMSMILTNFALAEIPQGCQPNLNEIIAHRKEFEAKIPDYIQNGELSDRDIIFIKESQKSVAEVVFILCSGLRKIELQRSLLGKTGLISQKKADREADQSYEEAKAFYDESF